MEIIKTVLLFAVTAVAEIVGCYLPYLWQRDGRSAWLLLPAALSLAAFAWLLTLHPAAAGRVYAAYGGVYIGVALACLWLDRTMPWFVVFPLAIIGSAAFGALWAFLPGWLQAKRGSHIVITTIMFNFIAASLMNYLLNKVFKPLGSMSLETRTFDAGGQLPKLDWLMSIFGLSVGNAPFNISFLLALFQSDEKQ